MSRDRLLPSPRRGQAVLSRLQQRFRRLVPVSFRLLFRRAVRRESLVVFDEVQMFPFARGLVKYLVADGRYDYVETGSLLSIKQNIQEKVWEYNENYYCVINIDNAYT